MQVMAACTLDTRNRRRVRRVRVACALFDELPFKSTAGLIARRHRPGLTGARAAPEHHAFRLCMWFRFCLFAHVGVEHSRSIRLGIVDHRLVC